MLTPWYCVPALRASAYALKSLPRAGFEPATQRFSVFCSTTELSRQNLRNSPIKDPKQIINKWMQTSIFENIHLCTGTEGFEPSTHGFGNRYSTIELCTSMDSEAHIRLAGLEPARSFDQELLKLSRLPFRHIRFSMNFIYEFCICLATEWQQSHNKFS